MAVLTSKVLWLRVWSREKRGKEKEDSLKALHNFSSWGLDVPAPLRK